MAIRLGNYTENKMLDCVKQKVAHQAKIDTIKGLVANTDNLVQLANDIYDTYCYIHTNDNEFAKQLWELLCRNRANRIRINSYFAWGAVGSDSLLCSHAYLSRYGVSIYHQSIKDQLMGHFGCDEKDLYRGKALLLDYLKVTDLDDNVLDKIIEELQVLIASFETYANDFFNSVSAYNVKKINRKVY